MKVIKRNGSVENFDLEKIKNAINKAMNSVNEFDESILNKITKDVYEEIKDEELIKIEEIQDVVENILIKNNLSSIAKEYILYRDKRRRVRENQSRMYEESQKEIENIMALKNIENANANVDEGSFSGKNAKVQGYFLKEWALNNLMSETTAYNHRNGIIYQHDLDNYASGMHNCLTVDFTDLYENEHGFKTRNGDVREPSNIMSFMQLVAVVFQAQSQCQFGGIASAKIDYEAAPYVHKSFVKNFKDALMDIYDLNENQINDLIKFYDNKLKIGNKDKLLEEHKKIYDVALRHTIRDTKQACESLFHNLNTLESRAGSQVPFSSINF